MENPIDIDAAIREGADLQRELFDARAAIADETKRADDQYDVARKWKGLADEREKMLADCKERIVDLKERLANAETANQFMRGYLARVQEDDVVREELLQIGDPDGEGQLVPKRKSTVFERPVDYSDPHRGGVTMGASNYFDRRTKRQPKHWITY